MAEAVARCAVIVHCEPPGKVPRFPQVSGAHVGSAPRGAGGGRGGGESRAGTLSRLSCEFTHKSQNRNAASSSLPPSARKTRNHVCHCESLQRTHCRSALGNPGVAWGGGSVLNESEKHRDRLSLGTAGRGRRPLRGFSWKGALRAARACLRPHDRGLREDATPPGLAPPGLWSILCEVLFLKVALHVDGEQRTESRRTLGSVQVKYPAS